MDCRRCGCDGPRCRASVEEIPCTAEELGGRGDSRAPAGRGEPQTHRAIEKKRRRHAGCWVHENGVFIYSLSSYCPNKVPCLFISFIFAFMNSPHFYPLFVVREAYRRSGPWTRTLGRQLLRWGRLGDQ